MALQGELNMEDQLPIRKLTERIREKNRRLIEAHADPSNADRALWGSLAVAIFGSVTGQSGDVEVDPETVLGDLLAGLMHWCDVQKTNTSLEESISFESALKRARNHYREECEAAAQEMS
jgi:hypothetical protein